MRNIDRYIVASILQLSVQNEEPYCDKCKRLDSVADTRQTVAYIAWRQTLIGLLSIDLC